MVSLSVVAREELLGTSVARRLEVSLRGTASAASLDLAIGRADMEIRDGANAVRSVSTDVVARGRPTLGLDDHDDEALRRLLEELVAAPVRLGFDPSKGVTSAEGLDAALDGAVVRDASLAEERDGLRGIAGDAVLLQSLLAAGLGPLPASMARRAPAERDARLRLPGLGETTLHLSGTVAEDESGLPALQVKGGLAHDAKFSGEPDAAPPPHIGAVALDRVEGEATTSYVNAGDLPVQGQWAVTIPFAGGHSIRRTTSFILVVR